MKFGIYTVETWNNKDATLVSEDGDFLTLTKSDLPKQFGGELIIGEKILVKEVVITTFEPLAGSTLDDRCRAMRESELVKQKMSQQQRDFIASENERRRRYGVKPL